MKEGFEGCSRIKITREKGCFDKNKNSVACKYKYTTRARMPINFINLQLVIQEVYNLKQR